MEHFSINRTVSSAIQQHVCILYNVQYILLFLFILDEDDDDKDEDLYIPIRNKQEQRLHNRK